MKGVGDLNNIHYYLLYLFPWLLFAVPRSRRAMCGLAVVAALSVLSEPQLIIYLPLVALVFWKRPFTRILGVVWVVGMIAQVLSTTHHRQSDLHDVKSGIAGYLVNVVGTNFTPNGPALGSLIARSGWGWLITIGVLILAVIGWLVRQTRSWTRLAVVSMVLASPVAWAMAYYLNDHRSFRVDLMSDQQLEHLTLTRWGTGAAMLLAAVIPFCADVVSSRYPAARWVPPVMVTGMVAVMCIGFSRSDNIRNNGHPWTAELAVARVVCANPEVEVAAVPQSPRTWTIAIPCSRLR